MKNLAFGGYGREGGRLPRFQKFGKASYRTVVPTHTENFITVDQLESVQKSGELKY